MNPDPTAAPAQLAGSDAHPTRLTVGGSEIAALRAGDPADPALLLVPGYTGSKEDFGPILRPLAAAGLFVTAIDLPGQYESPGSADLLRYTPDALAVVVLALAADLSGPVHLLGHSFGGLVARAAVIADAAPFASLVLMDSGPDALQGPRRALIEALEPVLDVGGMAGVYAASLAAAMTRPGFVAPPAALGEFLRRRFVASDPVMLRGMGAAIRAEPDRVAELATVLSSATLPSLVIFGEDDDAWPTAAQTAMAHRLGAHVAEVRGAAHAPAAENPQATVQALLGFWRQSGFSLPNGFSLPSTSGLPSAPEPERGPR
jgi:pimeloyl-ACP methyl ester carboxylesterase